MFLFYAIIFMLWSVIDLETNILLKFIVNQHCLLLLVACSVIFSYSVLLSKFITDTAQQSSYTESLRQGRAGILTNDPCVLDRQT